MAVRERTTLDASEPLRRGNHAPRARHAAGDGRPLRGPSRRRSPRRCGWPSTLTFDLTQDLGYRYPGAEDDGRRRATLAEPAARASSDRYRPGTACAPRRRAPGGGAGADRRARPVGLLPAAPRHARARARGRRRGARAGHRPRAAAARARARVVGLLDRLLPHRPLAHRPDREQALPRALPQRGDHRAAGHRPRLPARHPRAADPARARALRARPLGAGRGLPDLPRARGGPRARQGARSAAGRDRARRARLGGLVGAQVEQDIVTALGAERLARRAGRALARTWPRWPTRRTDCPATSPSTPAG